jgi:short subunit fatty acids transporter
MIIIKLNEVYGRSGCFLILGGILLNIVVCGALFRPLQWELEDDDEEDDEDEDEEDESSEEEDEDEDESTELINEIKQNSNHQVISLVIAILNLKIKYFYNNSLNRLQLHQVNT